MMRTTFVVSLVLAAGTSAGQQIIARYNFDGTGGNFPAVLDQATAVGQGTIGGPGDGGNAAVENLLAFNQLGGTYFSSSQVAPDALYANGNTGGASSYDASAIAGVNGALFMAQDQYGREFNLPGGFTVEMTYRTNGDQSGAGRMQMVLHGEGDLGWALIANEAGEGSLRFALQDSDGTFNLLDLTDRNYSDGSWHYLRAIYDADNREFSMLVASESGQITETSASLTDSFGTLRSVGGNTFIGRNTFSAGANPRTFLGLIDEMQVSSGVLGQDQFLGIPAPMTGAGLALGLAAAGSRRRG